MLFEIVTTTGGWLKGRMKGGLGEGREVEMKKKKKKKKKKQLPKQLCEILSYRSSHRSPQIKSVCRYEEALISWSRVDIH